MNDVRTVITKRLPNAWRKALTNAGNHNQTRLDCMATFLIPIKKVDRSGQDEKDKMPKKDIEG